MTYILLAFNFITIVLAVALVVAYRRDLLQERSVARTREDELLNRVVAPQAAAAQSLTELAPQPLQPAHVSAFDDDAWEDYEQKQTELQTSTRELIEQFADQNGSE